MVAAGLGASRSEAEAWPCAPGHLPAAASRPQPRQRRRCPALSVSISLPVAGASPAPASPGQVRPEAQRVPRIHPAPLGAAAARGSPSPSALPICPPLAAGRAGGLGLACGCSAGLGVSHPARGAASRARRHTGEAAGAGGERRGRQHRLPARPLAHAAEPQSAGAPLPPQPPPMTSSPARSR